MLLQCVSRYGVRSAVTSGHRHAAGRVGSAFAAELGTMAVSEQTDSLRVLGSDPVDYLVWNCPIACTTKFVFVLVWLGIRKLQLLRKPAAARGACSGPRR